jgi:metallophosphoesterase (TIGR00282 family)
MKILYIGDVMGEAGMYVVEKVLPALRQEKKIDLVIAQAENVSDGRGVRVEDFRRLQKSGIDFCTGGNWSMYRDEILPLLNDPNELIIRPANYPSGTAGFGYKYIELPVGKLLVISLLGKIVGKDADKPLDNPLQIVDRILNSERDTVRAGTIVNFHGDYSSEKVVIGHYLDGQVTMVVGDHWHVPTADARVLPNRTAHITDVGMCGTLDSSLGVSYKSVIPRWRDGQQTRNILENEGPKQFNGVLVDSSPDGLANSIEQIRVII